MLWACLRFPQLPLDALRIDAQQSCADSPQHGRPESGASFGAGAASESMPFAVIDGQTQRRHIVLANQAASRCGVRSGHALAAAQMLCPRLVSLPRDSAAEQQALHTLATWAYRYSAEIHVAAPDTLLIEVGASLALFDGWPALERRLRCELKIFGCVFSLVAAPTATGARVLAAQHDGLAITTLAQLPTALGALPLAASGLDVKIVAALRGMGFRNLRDLFVLPRVELTRRIGEEAIEHLDRMRGLANEALPRWRPPDRFERRIEFSFAIESQTALAFPLQRLIREFALFLVARDGGVQRFTLILGHEREASTRIDVGLLAPQRDASSLFELTRVRLERIQLGAPVHALTLRADDLPPLCPLHQDLFDTRRSGEINWSTLAERLRARLGDDALHGLACAADHRPARAWRFAASAVHAKVSINSPSGIALAARTSACADNVSASRPASMDGAHTRPFWLLRRPIILRETPARILAGPERIESGWWDEHDQRRDYYIIETRRGQRAWAFVEAGAAVETSAVTPRHPAQCGMQVNWTLHGWFA